MVDEKYKVYTTQYRYIKLPNRQITVKLTISAIILVK
jgi:hypothetical protein